MTFTLVRKLLRDIRISLIVVCLLLFLFEAFWVKVTQRITAQVGPTFDLLEKAQGLQTGFFQKKLFGGPAKVFQTIVGGDETRFNKPNDMMAIGLLHPLIQTILCIWAVGRAAGAIAGEIDRGTMELLLAQPLTRRQIILAHLWVDAIVIPILAVSMWMGSVVGCWILSPFTVDVTELAKELQVKFPVETVQYSIDPMMMLPGYVSVMALVFALSGFTMWISAAGRSRNRVMGLAILGTLLMFFGNVLAQLWDAVNWLRPFTVFAYYQPNKIVLKNDWLSDPLKDVGLGSFPVPGALILFLVGAFGYAMAFRTFGRRDIPAPL